MTVAATESGAGRHTRSASGGRHRRFSPVRPLHRWRAMRTTLFLSIIGSSLLLAAAAGCDGLAVGDAAQAASCSPVDPDPDAITGVIHALGTRDLACDRVGCLAYERVGEKPEVIAVSRSYDLAADICWSADGTCRDPLTEYTCIFSGDCHCKGLVDCFWMVWDGNCEKGSLDCTDSGCTCENTDGC